MYALECWWRAIFAQNIFIDNMNDADASIESRDFKMSFYKYAKVK